MSKLSLYVPKKDFDRPISPNTNKRAPYGSESVKDYSRILHSTFIRRLQGKMQLFPIGESDLLRTRLTHSHEVADVAVTICDKLNATNNYFSGENKIDRAIVGAIGLAHDIGHPPFGHDGEFILNTCMRESGAGEFEGNAQTLRILSKLENRLSRHQNVNDLDSLEANPHGLNLMYRTLAGLIKYDNCLMGPEQAKTEKPKLPEGFRYKQNKGFYPEEKDLVEKIRKKVVKGGVLSFPTIECQIMDIADDIAYSTYDLEDAMVAGIVSPLSVMSSVNKFAKKVAEFVNRKMVKVTSYSLDGSDVQIVLTHLFREIVPLDKPEYYKKSPTNTSGAAHVTSAFLESRATAENPILRRALTESLIDSAVDAIRVDINADNPELSRVYLSTQKLIEIECLKAFNFICVISSQNSRMQSQRGQRIVKFVFDTLLKHAADLLPDEEYRARFSDLTVKEEKARFVCDYVASMTDEEALSFYRRLATTDRMLVHNLHFPLRY